MDNYTPEPWAVTHEGPDELWFSRGYLAIRSPNAHIDDLACFLGVDNDANARRVVACVNACEGIPTDALEAGVIKSLVAAAKGLTAYLYATNNPGALPDEWRRLQNTLAGLGEVDYGQ